MIKLRHLLNDMIDMTIANPDMWKQEKLWKQYNKAVEVGGKTVFVILKKDKKTHYVWQAATPNFIRATDLKGKKSFTIKPKDVYQVVQLPHSGYKVPKGFNEGKLTEAGVNVWHFYKKANKNKNKFFKMLSDFRKKHSDTKWIKMLNYALKDFNENPKKYKTIDDKQNILFKNLQNNKKVYEGKLNRRKVPNER